MRSKEFLVQFREYIRHFQKANGYGHLPYRVFKRRLMVECHKFRMEEKARLGSHRRWSKRAQSGMPSALAAPLPTLMFVYMGLES